MDWALAAQIGSRIRQLRKGQGWSQAELARRIGVNKSVVGFFELGERFPTYDVLVKISETFGVSTDYLIKGQDAKASGIENLSDEHANAIRAIIAGLQQNNE